MEEIKKLSQSDGPRKPKRVMIMEVSKDGNQGPITNDNDGNFTIGKNDRYFGSRRIIINN